MPVEIQAKAGTLTFPSIWRTALACLYNLIPDPQELLRTFLPRASARGSFEWAIHAQLCQPVPMHVHVEIFTHLLQGQTLAVQLSALRSISLHGRAELAATLAGTLLIGHPAFSLLRTQTSLSDLDLPSLAARALALQQMGALYQLSGNRSQSLALLHSVENTLKHWLAGLYLQEMNLTAGDEGADPTVFIEEEKINSIIAASGRLKSELGAVIASHPFGGTLIDQLPAESSDPFLQIRHATRLASVCELALAHDLARQGVTGLIEQIRRTGTLFRGDFVFEWQPLQVLNLLRDLQLPQEALRLAQAVLEFRSTDTALLYETSRLCEEAGSLENACRYAQIAVGLEPQIAAWRRHLAQLWVKQSIWDRAYSEFEMVLALSNPPALKDRLDFAQVALKANVMQQVIEICQVVLNESPENGLAAGLLGQALARQGDVEQAQVHLSHATLFSPEVLDPWLALASLQREGGDPQRAIETLRAAVVAIPDSASGHLSLGEAYLAEGQFSEALPALKQAFLLSPNSHQAAYLYGKTLHTLGHTVEARPVIERTRSAWGTRPELPFEYAQTCLDLCDPDGALSALEVALRGQPPLSWYLLYVRVLLGEDPSTGQLTEMNASSDDCAEHLHQAETALSKVLDRDPEQVEARFFMAQISLERDDLSSALVLFQELTEGDQKVPAELHWRVQWGLGRAALRLGQTETALAALKEASQAYADCLDLQRDLAAASELARLPREALAFAEYALQLAPDQVDNLVWFAYFAAKLGEMGKAVEALECAVQLEPQRADFRVQLAQWQLSLGDHTATRASLKAALDLGSLDAEGLRQSAHTYLRMQDRPAALACLERAAAEQEDPSIHLLYELAQLYHQTGSIDNALSVAQRALSNPSTGTQLDSIPMYLLQADLLMDLHRSQAALASLERALRITQGLDTPSRSAELNELLVEIHRRFSILLVQNGSLPEALHHAEKALELNSSSVALRYSAADLALALLQIDRASRLAGITPGEYKTLAQVADAVEGLYNQDPGAAVSLLCLQIELVLETNQDENAERMITAGLFHAPDHLRLLAARVRSLARQGEVKAAQDLLEVLLKKNDAQTDTPALWLAQAALEAQRWSDAVRLFEDYTQDFPGEARAHLCLARALVTAAERQRLCECVGCQSVAPGAASLSESAHQKFENAIQAVSRLTNVNETNHWYARAQAVFAPSLQTARSLAMLLPSASDTSALVAVLRQLGNHTAAIQAARRHLTEPAVRLQMALCYLVADDLDEDQFAEGLSLAEQLVEDAPYDPLHHVVLARLSQRSGDTQQALTAYQRALQQWPQEANWQDTAGDLALELADLESGLEHREQALAYAPSNGTYATKLGKLCLAMGRVQRTIEVLTPAARLNPDQARIWLTLAQAYQAAGQLSQALEAAERASELELTFW